MIQIIFASEFKFRAVSLVVALLKASCSKGNQLICLLWATRCYAITRLYPLSLTGSLIVTSVVLLGRNT
jgi:hypothetical protein